MRDGVNIFVFVEHNPTSLIKQKLENKRKSRFLR